MALAVLLLAGCRSDPGTHALKDPRRRRVTQLLPPQLRARRPAPRAPRSTSRVGVYVSRARSRGLTCDGTFGSRR